MRSFLCAALCSLCLCGESFVVPAAADPPAIELTSDTASYTGRFGGGEIGVALYDGGPDVAPPGPGASVAGNVFHTFCLEVDEPAPFGQVVSFSVGTSAHRGGAGGGSPDPLDARTAWLYAQFHDGTLAGYAYAPGAARTDSATSLQLAIWEIEDEIAGNAALESRLAADAQAQAWIAAADAAVATGAWSGLGGVRVLDLLDAAGSDAQSVLVEIGVPAPCPLGLAPPVLVYDAIAGAATSTFAGDTRDLCPGDFDGDGWVDFVNLTGTGAQVFRNEGTVAGRLRFSLVQEFFVDYGARGCLTDVDGDGDLDLVLGDADYVIVGWNGGDCVFTPQIVHEHHWAVPGIAMPFRAFADPARPGNRNLVLLASTMDRLSPTALGVPDLRPWAIVYEISAGGRLTEVQRLDPHVVDDVVPRDVDGDGDVDLVLSQRTVAASAPLVIYESRAADTPGGLFVRAPSLSTSGLPFTFGFGIGVSAETTLAVGSWHRTFVWRRNPAFAGAPLSDPASAWLAPLDVLAGPLGGSGWPTGEVYAVGLGDFDGDGASDLVFQGSHTPLQLVSLPAGSPPGDRFVAAPTPGIARDLLVLDWDRDAHGAPDVLVGGSAGIHFHRNLCGGAAGAAPAVVCVPGPAPAADCSGGVYQALRGVQAMLDPFARHPVTDPAVRGHLAGALAEMIAVDPRYLASGALAQPLPPLEQVEGVLDRIRAAHARVASALVAPGLDPVLLPALTSAASTLVDATACLAEQAIALGGSRKRALPRRSDRLLDLARNDARSATRLAASAARSDLPSVTARLGRLAVGRNVRAFDRAVAAWRLRRPRA